jgi:polysaccharide biosynthesis/export protein
MGALRQIKIVLVLVATLSSVVAWAQGSPEGYRIGAGDTLRITVFQNPDLTLETRVGVSGVINYPLIGMTRIGGMTLPAAEQAIANALRDGKFIKQPQVSILPLQIRSNQVSVLGHVKNPGRFALETFDTRLSEMIAIAGGIAADGGDVVILTGKREGKQIRKEVDLPALFLDVGSRDDILVTGGDVIFVPRAPVFYIYGEVQRPGSYTIGRGMTVRQALVQGGGPTARGTERGLRVFRRGVNGQVETITPNPNDPVMPDDVLKVGESIF